MKYAELIGFIYKENLLTTIDMKPILNVSGKFILGKRSDGFAEYQTGEEIESDSR